MNGSIWDGLARANRRIVMALAWIAAFGLALIALVQRDAAGHLIGGLKAEDFVVLEDGRPQAIQVFGRAVDPGHDETLALDLGLLMDTSQSMLEELKLSQEAATRFLQAIPRARELITIFFDQDIRLSRYDSENQQGLFDRIEQAKGGGNTALYDAMAVYLSRVAGGTGRKVLVVFTDGDDTTSALSVGELIRLVRSSTVTIYPIAFTGGLQAGSPITSAFGSSGGSSDGQTSGCANAGLRPPAGAYGASLGGCFRRKPRSFSIDPPTAAYPSRCAASTRPCQSGARTTSSGTNARAPLASRGDTSTACVGEWFPSSASQKRCSSTRSTART